MSQGCQPRCLVESGQSRVPLWEAAQYPHRCDLLEAPVRSQGIQRAQWLLTSLKELKLEVYQVNWVAKQGGHFRDPVLRVRQIWIQIWQVLISLTLIFLIYKMMVKKPIPLGDNQDSINACTYYWSFRAILNNCGPKESAYQGLGHRSSVWVFFSQSQLNQGNFGGSRGLWAPNCRLDSGHVITCAHQGAGVGSRTLWDF